MIYFDCIHAGQSEFDMYTCAQFWLNPLRALAQDIRIDKPYSDFVLYYSQILYLVHKDCHVVNFVFSATR